MLSGRSRSLASIAVIFLVIANGWHLGFIQVIAWSNMTWDNTENMALTEAIQKALDGTEICGICQIVLEAENSDGSRELQTIEIVTKSLLILEDNTPLSPRAHPRFHPTLRNSTRSHAWIVDAESPPPKQVTA